MIAEINDLDLLISLPNQLTGHVSITELSDAITDTVEKLTMQDDTDHDHDDDDIVTVSAENSGDENDDSDIDDNDTVAAPVDAGVLPSLHDMFMVGQPLVCGVLSVEDATTTSATTTAATTATATARKRVELSCRPGRINKGVTGDGIVSGMVSVIVICCCLFFWGFCCYCCSLFVDKRTTMK